MKAFIVHTLVTVLILAFTLTKAFLFNRLPNLPGDDEILFDKLGNFSANPCEDFYKYACGNFISYYNWTYNFDITVSNLVFLEMYEKFDKVLRNSPTTSEAVSTTQKYYIGCQTYEWQDQLPLINIIKDFGYWSIYHNNSNLTHQRHFQQQWNIENTLTKTFNYNAFPFFIILGVSTNPTKILVQKPKFTDTEYVYFRAAVNETLTRLGRQLTEKDEPLINNMWKLEKELRDFSEQPEQAKRLPYRNMNNLQCSHNQRSVDMKLLLSRYFNARIAATTLVETNVDYLCFLSSVLPKHENETVNNYIVWTVIHSLTTSMANTPYRTAEQIKNNETSTAHEFTCMGETISRFNFSMIRLLVDNYLNKSDQETVLKMGQDIKREAKQHKLNFFDNETWRKAKVKLDKMDIISLYPNFIFNNAALDNYYKSYTGDYLSINIQHAFVQRQWQIMKLFQPRDEKNWGLSPIVESPFAWENYNKVHVGLSYSQKPLFYSKAPKELQYGSLGHVIGHEIMHLLLINGRDFDENGMENHWWSDTSANNFKNQNEKCYTDLYSNMEMFGKKLNGSLVLDETTADGAGLSVAYKALETLLGKETLEKSTSEASSQHTKAQAFFISFAQTFCAHYQENTPVFESTHPFHNIRVKGTLQNSKEFAEAFNCPSASAYNPQHKCKFYED